MAGTFFPCCTKDNCDDEITTQNDSQKHHQDEKGTCSPFFSCGTCAPAIEIATSVALDIPQTAKEIQYHSFYFLQLSYYHAALFQPPRVNC
jgi:hypothetical protein